MSTKLKKGLALPLVGFLLLLIPTFYRAQSVPSNKDTTVSLNLPTTPLSPAFFLMGIQPEVVERPGTPTDVALAIIGALTDPSGLAMEFTPYWMIVGSTTYEHYGTNKYPLKSLMQNASISLALSRTKRAESDTLDFLSGVGIRSSLFPGKIADYYEDSLSYLLREFNISYVTELDSLLMNDPKFTGLNEEYAMTEASETKRLSMLESEIEKREDEIVKKLRTEFPNKKVQRLENIREFTLLVPQKRLGFKLDVAAATTVNFPLPLGAWENVSLFNRWGTWFTTGYEWPTVGFLGTGRIIGDRIDSDSSSLDAGLRFTWDPRNRFSFSLEGVYHWFFKVAGDDNYLYRWHLIIDYDHLYLPVSLTIGEEYGNEGGKAIFSVSLKPGFGSERPVR